MTGRKSLFRPDRVPTRSVLSRGPRTRFTEASESWYQISSIAEEDSLNLIGQGDLTWDSTQIPGNPPVYVEIPDAQAGSTAVVGFTNDLVTGEAEICKADAANDPGALSGTFAFDITNTNDEESGLGGLTYDDPVSVYIPPGGNQCSNPITVPAGLMEVTEDGTNLYVTSISANLDSESGPTVDLQGAPLLGYANLVDGASISEVLPSTLGPGLVTVVSYTDATVGVEVCKDWSGDPAYQPYGTSTTYPFTETASGVAGPTAAPAGFSLTNGECSNPTQYRAGTTVTVTEGITPGTEVYAINDSGAESDVTGYPDITNRTTEFIVGAPVTGTTNGDEAEIDFINGLATPSSLKICKDAPDSTGPYTFTVTGPQYVQEFLSTGEAEPGLVPLGDR